MNWAENFKTLRELPPNILLSQPEWIKQWIYKAADNQEYHYVRVNELMETLRLQGEYSMPELYDFYFYLAQDTQLDIVLRDYALQHLCLHD